MIDISMDKPEQVEKYMASLSHPLKKEVDELRKIVKNVNKNIAEQIKWNAPSFSYNGEYLVTFNIYKQDRILLVFHHPKTPELKSKILEGDYKDGRRLTYFFDMNDVKTKKKELEYVIKNLVKLTDNK